ncbi:MAG: TatD family hydrolase [Spirochaetaceae bacterium]|nr:TatD family hydrolase [Spirochaetaceae bacterium]
MTDAHCHHEELLKVYPAAEEERQRLGVKIAKMDGIHPQYLSQSHKDHEVLINETLCSLCLCEIQAIGEIGFDLFPEYRPYEKAQEEVFAIQLALAIEQGLPVVLHVRKAMHKVFSYIRQLKQVPALVFHSYSGTVDDSRSLMRHGLNVYFSFGNAICLNHKQARQCVKELPLERLLTETDAPYQPQRGRAFSSYADLPIILNEMALLRNGNAKEIEEQIDINWHRVFESGHC